ncbi:NADH dehydrogenase [ubiquinone] 1 beta subcomplex subunit 9 [Anthophora quadrimaculata]
MAQIPSGLVSHSKKVCSLYKRGLRAIESYCTLREDFRYQAVLLRERFEKNRNIRDARIAKQLLLAGEEELFLWSHPQPKYFPESPEGIAYERFSTPPDSVLDYWEPIEKAQYPKFFAEREVLKKEYGEFYNKMYGGTSEKTSKSDK